MNNNHARDLFQLQLELLDTKVDMAATRTIDRVLQKIDDLKTEMQDMNQRFHTEMHDMNQRFHTEIHGLRHDMHASFSKLDTRVVAIETKLGMIGEKKRGIYNRIMDYLFKAGYGILTLTSLYFAYALTHIYLTH